MNNSQMNFDPITGQKLNNNVDQQNNYQQQLCNFPNRRESDVSYQQPNNFNQNYSNESKTNNKKNIFLFVGIGIGIIVLIVGFILLFNKKEKKMSGKTFMIYMVGSDLESDNKMATYDLEDIVPNNINLEQNKIVLMVGGSPEWHNFVDKNETAIYELKPNGFVKVKTTEIKNMGSYETLLDFLNYSYNNYKTGEYNLIFWNHGLGASGFQYDTLSNDFLTLDEFEYALRKSPFNKNNKMETVIFKTCLSGNLHFASVVDEYAKYMVASEEVSWSSPIIDTFNFLSQVVPEDTGVSMGKKFIDSFSPTIEDFYNKIDATYSVIDLSKISKIEKNLDDFVSSINLNNYYSIISKTRSIIKQYGQEEKSFDTIDLYQFAYNLKSFSNKNADKLLESLEQAVVYNRSKTIYSHGLSIYFPYNGTQEYIDYEKNNLLKVNNSKYLDFITDFTELRLNKSDISFSSLNKAVATTKSDFSLQLSKEEYSNYARATFTVFRDMGDGYYMPMYTSSDVKENDNGLLTANYNGKALKVIDTSDNSEETLLLIEKSNEDGLQTYLTYATLNSFNEKTSKIDVVSANLYLSVNDKNPKGKIDYIVKNENNNDNNKKVPSMSIIDLKDYSDLYFLNYKYKILDNNGNYTENWQSSGIAYMFRTGTNNSDYKIEISHLDDGYKYYCVFKIFDSKNNYHYSNLISMQ